MIKKLIIGSLILLVGYLAVKKLYESVEIHYLDFDIYD